MAFLLGLFERIFEIILGVMLLIPKFSRIAAYGLIILLIGVFAANIYMALNTQLFPELGLTELYLRLPIQFVLIAWAYWLTKNNPSKKGRLKFMDWQKNILTTDAEIKELLQETKNIAVVGIKTEQQAFQPAYYVPQYMQKAGIKIIPVPVYYPDVTEILGEKVYRSLVEIPEDVDMVNLFRRSDDVPKHTEDILAKRPKSVWMQLGIYNDEVAQILAKEGIKVVQDLCLMVEHRALIR